MLSVIDFHASLDTSTRWQIALALVIVFVVGIVATHGFFLVRQNLVDRWYRSADLAAERGSID